MSQPLVASLLWISPLLPLSEVEALQGWLHDLLIQSGSPQSKPLTAKKKLPVSYPHQGISLEYHLTFLSLEHMNAFQQTLMNFLYQKNTVLPDLPYLVSLVEISRRTSAKKLIAFDFDSTLIEEESINEVAEYAGVGTKVIDITERAMAGELDFNQALRERCLLLQGLNISYLEQVKKILNLTEGAEDTLQHFKALKYTTMVVSGGFDFILKDYQHSLGLDYVFSNRLLVDDQDCLTGTLQEPILDGLAKQQKVAFVKSKLNLPTDAVIAVGDGANDLLMMKEAALQVSFLGKEKLTQTCNTYILHRDLRWLTLLA